MQKLLKALKWIGFVIGGLFALFFISGGTKRIKAADEKMKKALELRNKADAIDAYIEKLKAKGKLMDQEIEEERKRIEGLQTLEEIEDEFTRLGY